VYGNTTTATITVLEEVSVIDVCTNIEGLQSVVPLELTSTDGECVKKESNSSGGGGCRNCDSGDESESDRSTTPPVRSNKIKKEEVVVSENREHVAGTESVLKITDVLIENIDTPLGTSDLVWETNLPAQGLVVCSLMSQTLNPDAQNFGYQWSTVVIRGLTREHYMPLTDLAVGPHYCRVGSRLSQNEAWVFSEELLFHTKGAFVQGEGLAYQEVASEGVLQAEETSDSDDRGDEQEERTSQAASVAMFLSSAFSFATCGTRWWVCLLVPFVVLVTVMGTRYALFKRRL